MNAVISPLESVEKDRQVPARYSRWGVVGRWAWWCVRPTKWQAYFQTLKRQVAARGPVSADTWQTPQRYKIASEIEAILGDSCWVEKLSFHPDDAWRIIGAWEIGDLSELDALHRVEKRFGVPLPREDFAPKILAGMTFGELVTIIENEGSQTISS